MFAIVEKSAPKETTNQTSRILNWLKLQLAIALLQLKHDFSASESPFAEKKAPKQKKNPKPKTNLKQKPKTFPNRDWNLLIA